MSPFFSFPHPGASCGASQTLNNSRDTPRAEAGTTPRYNQAKGAPCLKSPSALPRLPPTPGPPRGEGAAAFCAPTAPAEPGGGALPSPNPTPGDDKRGLLPAAGPEEGAPRGSARSPPPRAAPGCRSPGASASLQHPPQAEAPQGRAGPVTCWLRGMSAAIFLPLIRAAAGAGEKAGEGGESGGGRHRRASGA